MQYGFNCRVAELYGVNEAVFIQSIYWWIQKNEAGGRHFHDGRSWTYDTMDKLLERFPFWSKRQLERIIQKLRDNGALYIGNYNASPWNRTHWYALSETVLSIYADAETESGHPAGSIPPDREMEPAGTGVCSPPYGEMEPTKAAFDIPQYGEMYTVAVPDKLPVSLYPEIVGYLNQKARASFSPTSAAIRRLIDARINEGFTLPDFRKVIDNKCAEWGSPPEPGGKDMRPYLRPETLFGMKFRTYLSQKPPAPRQPVTARTAGSSIDYAKLDALIDWQFCG